MARTTESKVGHVYSALSAISKHISKIGVEKVGENKKQGYHFRGIDQVMDVFAGPLAQNQLLVAPVYSDMARETLVTKGGSSMVVVTVALTLTFVSLKDGSTFTVGPFWGEGSDTLDKATSKAHSVAYRNGMLLTFTAPLGPEMDPEHSEVDHELDGKVAAIIADQEQGPGEKLTETQRSALLGRLKAVGKDPVEWAASFGEVGQNNFKVAMSSLRSES